MELRHDPNKDTATTITLEWTPVPGAQGYRFSSSDMVKRSHTWDPTRSSVKFSKGADWYRVEALDVLQEGVWPAPEPPPPPATKPLFDGRATQMNSITGSTLYLGGPGWAGSSNASQDPHIWGYKANDIASGVYVIGDDCTLPADTTYGKIFRFTVGVGSSNPYLDLNADGRASAELSIERPISMGQWDWYATAFRIRSPVNVKSWHVISQFGYPSITSPPLAIVYDSNGLGLDLRWGVWTGPGTEDGLTVIKPRWYTLGQVTDRWVEYLIGVKWAMDGSGEFYTYSRCRDIGETGLVLKHHRTGPTFMQKSGAAVKTTVTDKVGNYFGKYSSSAAILTNIVEHRGFTRWADEASARASLG